MMLLSKKKNSYIGKGEKGLRGGEKKRRAPIGSGKGHALLMKSHRKENQHKTTQVVGKIPFGERQISHYNRGGETAVRVGKICGGKKGSPLLTEGL